MAWAGSPGEWTRITDPTGANIDEVGLARTSDGILHIAWLRKSGNQRDLMHTAIGVAGDILGVADPIVTGWSTVSNPDLIVSPTGDVQVFFGGLGPAPYDDGSLYTATSENSGASWTLGDGPIVGSTSAYASPTGAAATTDGRPVTTWATTYGLGVHLGLDPTDTDQKLQAACCAYQPDLATDEVSAEVVLGWYSNAAGETGLYTQSILPSLEAKQFVPGSATADRSSGLSLSQRMAITGRRGAPGVYVAYCAGYPTCKTVNLWRHKSPEPMVVAQATGARLVNIAPGPAGRLWVMWVRSGRFYAARSNRQASQFGPVVAFDPPKGTESIWKLKGEGSNGALDVLAAVSTSPKDLATWHTQVLPRLTLSANPKSFTAAEGATVTFSVTDAGDAVEGTTITLAGKSLTTDAKGKASYTFSKETKPGNFEVTAKKSGYADASLNIVAR